MRCAGAAPRCACRSSRRTASRWWRPGGSRPIPSRSKYQLIVDRLAPAGVGALMALLEERRKQLAAEGLFDAARKRPLPFLPEVIGVVTSPTGAVIRDILHRLAERFPRRVLLWPVAVQGEFAAEQVAAAISGFNALPGRSGAAPGRADRRPRRRLARGSVGVQRGGRGARRGGQPDPADLGGRPRDRHHADRPCRRPAGADADGRRRARRAGARRARPSPGAARPPDVPWHAARAGRSSSSGWSASRAACRTRSVCSATPRNGSTTWRSACRMCCTPGSSAAGCTSRGSRRGCARPPSWSATPPCASRASSIGSRTSFAALCGTTRVSSSAWRGRLSVDELRARLPRHASALADLASRQNGASRARCAMRRRRLRGLGQPARQPQLRGRARARLRSGARRGRPAGAVGRARPGRGRARDPVPRRPRADPGRARRRGQAGPPDPRPLGDQGRLL